VLRPPSPNLAIRVLSLDPRTQNLTCHALP
jgi:hypothetical protein